MDLWSGTRDDERSCSSICCNGKNLHIYIPCVSVHAAPRVMILQQKTARHEAKH
jgi:hypothetical protein